MDTQIKTIDCACVIHGDAYSWKYVDTLYNMLDRHLTPKVRLHVYTEAGRVVPAPYVKHELTDWGIAGPRRAWWYKIQLFNSAHHAGPLLYFDLDTVVVDNIDWICQQPLRYFWAVRDFKYLWKPNSTGLNSSIMWWDTRNYDAIWQIFQTENFDSILREYRGDQDYITAKVRQVEQRFFDPRRIKSWRWQCLDGGYNFQTQKYLQPNIGTRIDTGTSVLIFHGAPKPSELTDDIILQYWK